MIRIVGIRHRVKATAEGEARPTEISLQDADGTVTRIELPEEIDELDFVHGRFPLKYRAIAASDDLSHYLPHHVIWRKPREGESLESMNPAHVRTEASVTEIAVRVPEVYEGLQSGDRVAMILGGSGDYFAYALARKGRDIGASVLRVPSFILKKERGGSDKSDDSALLASLCARKAEIFYPVAEHDLTLLQLRIATQERRDEQRDRIACNNRVSRRAIGAIFCSEDGFYPEGGFQKAVDERKANSALLSAHLAEEKRLTAELAKLIERVDVYTEVLSPVEGMGPSIAAPIIAAIGDIRRFETAAKLKAYCGVHVLSDGRFPRRRSGDVANWNGALRQALYLFGDQCVKRKDSKWGKYQRKMKAALRERHPEPIVEDGKKRYSDGHIHKMATWRTLTRFVEWLHREWWHLERQRAQPMSPTGDSVVSMEERRQRSHYTEGDAHRDRRATDRAAD